MIIHQVYGLFRDDKPMNELFTQSSKHWKEYAERNDHIYKLWTADECDELVNTYDEIKKYYYDVKYPIMKCDIIRFLIVYQFGGMYVDLDVLPNKNVIKIDPTKLTLCKYPNRNTDLDIEIISSYKYNQDLYKYLQYIPTQIEEKDKIDVYKDWKVRYVFQTTGPRSYMRYAKLNKIKCDTISVIHLNDKQKYGEVDLSKIDGIEDIDCISYFSMSYNTKKNIRAYKTNKTSQNTGTFSNDGGM